MSLTKDTSAQSLMSAVTVAAGTPQNSAAQAIGYGCSIVGSITNGGTGPTVAASATLQVSADGTTWYSTNQVQTAGVAASTTYPFEFDIGVGGNGPGDWANARVQVGSNTGQSVTANAVASHTSAL